MLYKFLDIFFLVFHLMLVLFVLFGWIWRKTRRWNLIVIMLTLASWFLLGIKYGIGYCPLTDWHFQVLRKMGETGMPSSYISYLVVRFTSYMPSQNIVDTLTFLGAMAALIASLFFNIRDMKRPCRRPRPSANRISDTQADDYES